MSPKRLRISEGETEERCYSDPLNSLPDELIRLILFKITDPKTLFVSSLVSKRIASILSHSQSLSLLPGEILRLIFSKITDPKTLLACFLVSKRFASILSHSQSLSLQFPTHLSFPHLFSQFPSASNLFPNLDCVELVDSKKHGKLIKLRTTMLDWTPENMSNFITQRPSLEKIWYLPKLRLPVSGFEMKEVALMVSRDRNGGGCGGVWEEFEGSSDDALDGGFEDDEHGIFGEAMTQILTKHPLKTTYS